MRLLLGRLEFQSTLLQEERLSVCIIVNYSVIISIHAPTRGATGILLIPAYKHSIFQSTLLQEERQRRLAGVVVARSISIHAPTRGATILSCQCPLAFTISIHAPTRGATIPSSVHLIISSTISIHAPTRGATRQHQNQRHQARNFNPRSYKRSDFKFCIETFIFLISIHAPTRGATKASDFCFIR